MKHITSKHIPNPSEQPYWVDLNENPYGGIIKYYNADLEKWVYFDEPIFQQSAAYKLTNDHITAIEDIVDYLDFVSNILGQLDRLNEDKADRSEIVSKEEVEQVHTELTANINKNAGNIITLKNTLQVSIQEGDNKNSNRIEEVNSALSNEIGSLKDAVQKGYDDTEIRNALSEKTSYTYVEQQILNITGVPPTVLNTLEELATALGNDPNFAATITNVLATKLDREQTIQLITELKPSLLVETDPTVPQWAKQSTKPVYTANEVGALPITTKIPNKTTDLTNDAGFVTRDTVISMISANKPLTAEQYVKLNKLDSYVTYELTESDLSLPIEYKTIVANTISDKLNISFANTPMIGSSYTLYVNPKVETTIDFYTLSGDKYHTAIAKDMMRFDITIIDLTKYSLVTENGSELLTSDGHTIVCNIVDGYIIDYIRITSDDALTWYEGE